MTVHPQGGGGGGGGGGQSASLANQLHCTDVSIHVQSLALQQDGTMLNDVLELQLRIAAVISSQ